MTSIDNFSFSLLFLAIKEIYAPKIYFDLLIEILILSSDFINEK